MPRAPQKPCNTPGCGVLVASSKRFCEKHDRLKSPTLTIQKNAGGVSLNRHERGYSNEWVAASKAFLARNPLCRRCLDRNFVRGASVTDHIVPHKNIAKLFWDENNWQPLCKRCHDQKTFASDAPASKRPGWLPIPKCRVVLVVGPHAAGKSTLVRERATPHRDIVIDLDEIISELSGEPLYHNDHLWISRGIRERNRRIANLSTMTKDKTAFVIVTGKWGVERDFWVDKLRPEEIIVLATPEHICCARVMADSRRAAVVARQTLAIREWWNAERASKEAASRKEIL
jgi:5-methylcytosine-specific restriction enzyme A